MKMALFIVAVIVVALCGFYALGEIIDRITR